MGKICWSRVLLGGLVAGVLINISEMVLNFYVVGDEFAAEMQRLGVTAEESASSMVVWILFAFVTGVAIVWLYAAIRPRYGAGVKTALCAGATVWFFATLMPTVGMVNMGLFPAGLMTYGAIWSLIEMLLAAFLGAWLYKE